MIERLIEWSVHNRLMVVLLTGVLVAAGIWAIQTTPVDAIPDLSDVQVIVFTEYGGQGPEVVEDQVTYPLTSAMLSVPFAKTVRGYSFFGFSMVYVIFEEGTDLYWARSRVLEYINVVQERLPEGVSPQLGPDATGVGWVYMYSLSDFGPRAEVLRQRLDTDGDGVVADAELPAPTVWLKEGGIATFSGEHLAELFGPPPPEIFPDLRNAAARAWSDDSVRYIVEGFDRDGDGALSYPEFERAVRFEGLDLAQLRSLQDWFFRFELMSLDGVAEVAAVGGHVRQYQVEVDPERLRAYGVTLNTVRKAIQRSNSDVGGRLLEMGETEFMVRGKGYIASLDDLESIPLGVDKDSHTPILLRQVARVQLGPEIRRGVVDMNGLGEVVTGVIVMRFGEDAMQVAQRVRDKLEELKPGLPEGVEIHVSYDRSSLIQRAIDTLKTTLVEELAIVALVCLLFLFHLRSSLVTVVALPLGVLSAFLAMRALGINANIMSLGGIAIAVGELVDSAIVMIENLHKHKERYPERSHKEHVIGSTKEVGPALFSSLLVVTVSFLPVFALQAQEGRLFRPLALTKTFAMASSAFLSISVVPVLLYYFVRGKTLAEEANPATRALAWVYRPIIRGTLRFPRTMLFAAVLVSIPTIWPLQQLGGEFMPPLNEGDLLYMPTTPPGLSITKAKELLQQTDKIIASHPQVKHVLGKSGRAMTATDPAPLSMLETTILLTDKETWPKGKQIEDVISELDAMVQFPGLTNAWTMPIKTRLDMLATGIKTPVGVKLLGDDLDELSEVGQRIEAALRPLPDTLSVYSERVVGGNFIDVDIRRHDAARYGLTVGDIQDVVKTALGGMNVTWTVEGLERYPVNVRFPRELRDDLDKLGSIAVSTPMGHTIPLRAVADISVAKGPPAIKSENARRTAWIFVDLKTSDVGGYVKDAKDAVRRSVTIPPGVSIEWSGQYEYMQRANERLMMVVPLTLVLILLLLFAHFGNMAETLLVLGTLPFALVGGIWLLWLMDFNMSVAVGVGLIALAGLAAETGVVMLVYLDETWNRWVAEGRVLTIDDLKAVTIEGAVDRVRPKVMTVVTSVIALLPVMIGTDTGTRVMKRIAAPMVGGLISSTVLTLVIIPAAWFLWRKGQLPAGVEAQAPEGEQG
ncbi:MAG: CusA/CzcA family heavy metal efflux RND transporter [Deltaproteobacteria bacterium]|nr:CusA/CzcA family heavy metal efflux RND transporter [Deltaproteobacteria bacterium]